MGPPRPSDRPTADEGPLARAYLERRDQLVLFLAARSRSMEAAEDLVQDLYLKVAALPADTDVRSPVALLYRMAVNLMVDQGRGAARSARRNADWRLQNTVIVGGEEVAETPAADEVLVSRERVRQLAEAVAALPPQMGRAFRLHKLEGRSQAETAEAMGVSVKMIEQHIQAAVRNLARAVRP